MIGIGRELKTKQNKKKKRKDPVDSALRVMSLGG